MELIRPGVTTFPLASIVCAPAGTVTCAPTATIIPSRIKTVPLLIGGPLTGYTFPFVIAIVWEKTVVAAAARITAIISARISVALLDRAEFKIRAPALGRIRSIEHHRSINPDFLSFRVDAERIS